MIRSHDRPVHARHECRQRLHARPEQHIGQRGRGTRPAFPHHLLDHLWRNPEATRLAVAANMLFGMVDILPWTAEAAESYGELRARMRRVGTALQPLDMLIAAHAVSVGAILVTADKAFRNVPGLEIDDWKAPRD